MILVSNSKTVLKVGTRGWWMLQSLCIFLEIFSCISTFVTQCPKFNGLVIDCGMLNTVLLELHPPWFTWLAVNWYWCRFCRQPCWLYVGEDNTVNEFYVAVSLEKGSRVSLNFPCIIWRHTGECNLEAGVLMCWYCLSCRRRL